MKKIIVTVSTLILLLFANSNGSLAASHTYTVKSGDTLSQIAKKYHTSVSQIKQWNHLHSDLIHPKQVLCISNQSTSQAAKKSTHPAKKAAKKVVKELTVSASAYTLNLKNSSGVTAIGINLKKNPNQKVISVDPKVIKLGTKVYVQGYGYAIAGDTGGAIKGNKIDVFLPSQQQALKWGRKTVKVQILK